MFKLDKNQSNCVSLNWVSMRDNQGKDLVKKKGHIDVMVVLGFFNCWYWVHMINVDVSILTHL